MIVLQEYRVSCAVSSCLIVDLANRYEIQEIEWGAEDAMKNHRLRKSDEIGKSPREDATS